MGAKRSKSLVFIYLAIAGQTDRLKWLKFFLGNPWDGYRLSCILGVNRLEKIHFFFKIQFFPKFDFKKNPLATPGTLASIV